MPRICDKCKAKYSMRQRLLSAFAGRKDPLVCLSCGHKAVIIYNFQFYIILILAVGGASVVSVQDNIFASAVALLVLIALFLGFVLFSPVQSVEDQEKVIKEETSFESISIFRILLISVGGVYAFFVIAIDSNIVSAIFMLLAVYAASRKEGRLITAVVTALLSVISIYAI